MEDIFLDGVPAFQQVSMLIIGSVLLLIGGLLLGNEINWRLKALRVTGTVMGVRAKKNCYYPVYHYTLPTGETLQSTSSSGSSLTRGKETGRQVPLLVMPHEPERVEPADSWLWLALGLFFFIPGAGLAYLALTVYPWTIYTAVILSAYAVYGFLGFRKYIIPKEQRKAPNEWKAERKAARRKEMESLPVQMIEELLNAPEKREEREEEAKNTQRAMPFVLLFACVFFFAGYNAYKDLSYLEKHGIRAEGQVVRFEQKDGKNGTAYYPVVSFTTEAGKQVTFKSNYGVSFTFYKTGEKVPVIYIEKRPERAAIDKGLMPWVPAIVAWAIGFLLIGVFLRFYRF